MNLARIALWAVLNLAGAVVVAAALYVLAGTIPAQAHADTPTARTATARPHLWPTTYPMDHLTRALRLSDHALNANDPCDWAQC